MNHTDYIHAIAKAYNYDYDKASAIVYKYDYETLKKKFPRIISYLVRK